MFIAANWKAYVEDAERAKKLAALGKRLAGKCRKHEIVLAPAALHLGMLAQGNKSKVKFAAQDVSLTTGGAHTGEVSAQMLENMDVAYTLVGHSERRAMGETDIVVAEKARHALAHGVVPIVCVGERERDAGAEYLSLIRAQISAVFAPLTPKERLMTVIAYEPVWAIGKSAADALPSHEVMEMALYIRKVLGDFLPGKAPAHTKILYGGSVEPGNIRDLAAGSGIDGFLIGHASVDSKTFSALVKALS
ncbi:MAG TPA: triose-phosphate isomerase [Candidatus Paceibacterota bacterium]|nr:triose-phosphate isomerase [Candidatus Paceibacterota bacterium]